MRTSNLLNLLNILNDDGTVTFEEVEPCETVNCSRRAPFSQMNLRISKGFRLRGTTRVEAIAEVFNLFNAKNPALPLTSGSASRSDSVSRRASSCQLPASSPRRGTGGWKPFVITEYRICSCPNSSVWIAPAIRPTLRIS
jgi:hypothetical protein